jgi:hypothetical protein
VQNLTDYIHSCPPLNCRQRTEKNTAMVG